MTTFNVGDRVRIRGSNLKIEITEIHASGNISGRDNKQILCTRHPELLIKLKPKKRVEGWFVVDKDGDLSQFDSRQDALDKIEDLNKTYPCYAPYRAVYMVEGKEKKG